MQYLHNFSEEMKALFPRGEIFNSCIQIDNVLSALEQNEEIENNIREALLYEHDEEPYKQIAETVYHIYIWCYRKAGRKRREGLDKYYRLMDRLNDGSESESGYETSY